jgi:hypothetical protein
MPIPSRPTNSVPNPDAPGTRLLIKLTQGQQDFTARNIYEEILAQGYTWQETDNLLRRSLQLMIQKFESKGNKMPHPQTTRANDLVAKIAATANYNAAFMNSIRLLLLPLTEYDVKAILSTTFS